jgi:hypothetical protein
LEATLHRAPRAIFGSILLIAVTATMAACHRSYCESQCSCNADRTCSTVLLNYCEQQATGTELAAHELGCSKEYDALLSCQTETVRCITDYWILTTACDIQQSVYDKCMAAAQGK